MRKVLWIILCLALCVSLCSCVPAQQNDIEEENDNSYENWENTEEDPPRKTEEELWQEEYDEVVAYCEECVARGDYLGALNYSKEKAEGDAGYESLYAKYAKLYVDKKLEEAKGYADNREFAKAIEVLNTANETYNCAEFIEAIDDYTAFLPKKLHECHIIEHQDYIWFQDGLYDCYGKEYADVFSFYTTCFADRGYAVFFLDGKYTKLSGTFAPSNRLFRTSSVQCSILGDGIMLYETSAQSRTSFPVNINIDITGVKQLTVICDGELTLDDGQYVSIFDLMVS